MLRRVRVLVVLASIAGALTVGAAGASAADWVGLGDSYAAGPLIPNQSLNPLGCLRSDHNFAQLAAAALGADAHRRVLQRREDRRHDGAAET